MATKAKAKRAAGMEFDPRSDKVVLEYRGTDDWQPALGGIPARDLSDHDIARLVYAQAINDYDGTPDGPPMPDPERPSQAKARGLVELLLERRVDGKAIYGLAKTKPAEQMDEAAPAAPDNEPPPADAPAQPEV